MPTYLTLQKISQSLLSELLRSRTDFLLHQTAMWQQINDAAKVATVFAKPESLDLYHTRFEFCIVKQEPGIFTRILNWFRKPRKEDNLFRLCGSDETKGIKVTISIRLQSDKEIEPDITTEPESGLKPKETYVSGIAV
jgi:hypothetical protein